MVIDSGDDDDDDDDNGVSDDNDDDDYDDDDLWAVVLFSHLSKLVLLLGLFLHLQDMTEVHKSGEEQKTKKTNFFSSSDFFYLLSFQATLLLLPKQVGIPELHKYLFLLHICIYVNSFFYIYLHIFFIYFLFF